MSIINLFFILLFVAFAVIFYVSEPSKEDKLVDARLIALDQSRVMGDDEEKTILRQVIFSRVPALDRFLRRNKLALYLQKLIAQANVNWTVGRIVFAISLCVGLGALLGNWWISSGLLGWAPGLVLGVLPVIALIQMRKRRFHRFASLLPEAVDLMSRCLRSGQALTSTLEIVAVEMPEPLGTEFQRAAEEQNYGLPFRESMLNLVARVPIPDLQFLVTAMLVQKETGGNLIEILDKTSYVLRERIRVHGQMKVKTAHARFSGWILCLLPFAIFLGMNIISPGVARILFEDPTGRKWVTSAAVMMVIGILMIRRVVNVKI
jgi:tight adherence protein B